MIFTLLVLYNIADLVVIDSKCIEALYSALLGNLLENAVEACM